MLKGSICLSKIPREVIKKVKCNDGVERKFVNFAIFERKEPVTFGDRTYNHFMSVAPKKEERKDGVNYIVANLQTFQQQPTTPTPEQVEAAPPVSPTDDLPF